MCHPDVGPLTLIRWGYRSLYVLLFISCMVVMGYWHVPITLPFLGSVFALILPLLFSKHELFSQEEEDDMNT